MHLIVIPMLKISNKNQKNKTSSMLDFAVGQVGLLPSVFALIKRILLQTC